MYNIKVSEDILIKIYSFDDESMRKKDVFMHLGNIAENNKIIRKKKHFIFSLLKREKLGETGMVNGIAIPHAISSKILLPSIIILRTKHNINDWEMLDDSKARVIICLSMPKKNSAKHLDLLSNVSKSLIDQNVQNQLFMENDEQKIWQMFNL